ncbi:hypothetical protein Back11_39340 [Paenibacillus baekrokdamisoli]|uniref:Uncharacterized protein n=1 Tax=Paenibacillus baekrokdamisoli TaxID=1712516 RepID=A0A3G9JHV0_9BACL|nr:phosphopantetheine-binding protein [Paenibacillus baekrokdamisoli]MBB3068366.1 D-alanine--poly(phosphoribitol) ligase subunit 2 [Paenibacillus baekrokdamisoli]BBH22589.1 hypothetical protein Back11_39340 [Paenibacillus baekrokdamisoli]
MDTTKIVHNKVLEVLKKKDSLGMDINLMEHGLDSLTAIQLIVALEEEMGITFDDEYLLLENFETIEKIVMVIEKIQAFF